MGDLLVKLLQVGEIRQVFRNCLVVIDRLNYLDDLLIGHRQNVVALFLHKILQLINDRKRMIIQSLNAPNLAQDSGQVENGSNKINGLILIDVDLVLVDSDCEVVLWVQRDVLQLLSDVVRLLAVQVNGLVQ